MTTPQPAFTVTTVTVTVQLPIPPYPHVLVYSEADEREDNHAPR